MADHQIVQKLQGVQTRAGFAKLAAEIREWDQSELFEELFGIALDARRHPFSVYGVAADLLVKLDPRCPIPCREAIYRIAGSNWDVSLRQIPFYVVTQFGKQTVAAETEAILADGRLDASARQTAVIFGNWAKQPATLLAAHYFCRWESWGQPEGAQLGVSPNAGPAERSGNLGVSGGPPSVT